MRRPNETEITLLIECSTCPGRPVACDDCMMTVFMGPVGVRSSDNAEVRCDEFVIDDETCLAEAVALFHAAGMLPKSDTDDHQKAISPAQAHFSGGNQQQLWAV